MLKRGGEAHAELSGSAKASSSPGNGVGKRPYLHALCPSGYESVILGLTLFGQTRFGFVYPRALWRQIGKASPMTGRLGTMVEFVEYAGQMIMNIGIVIVER
jgi:hypothetical protein